MISYARFWWGGKKRVVKKWLQSGHSDLWGCSFRTYHIKSSEDMAVVVTGLEIFGDVGKCREILWILSCTRDVTDLVFRYDILQRQKTLLITSTEQIILLFHFYYSSHSKRPKTTIAVRQFCFSLLSNSCWVNFLYFHIGEWKSIFSCFHFIVRSVKRGTTFGSGHGTWTQVESSFFPLWIPLFSLFLINSPLWSYNTVRKNEK